MGTQTKKDTGIVDIHGKQYQTVAHRIGKFREAHLLELSITSELISVEGDYVIMKATIANAEGFVIATGHAEEKRNSSNINKTSALENCETSAIGRALASLGMGGTEFASADEVANAIHKQSKGEKWTPQPNKANEAIKDAFKTELDNAKTSDEVYKIMMAAEQDPSWNAWPDAWQTGLNDLAKLRDKELAS